MKFFQKKKSPIKAEKIEDPTEVIDMHKTKIANFNARLDILTKESEQLQNDARTHLKNGNQKAARYALQRRKNIETEIKQTEDLRTSMESQVFTLEMSKQQKEVISTIKIGVDIQKKNNQYIDVGELDKMVGVMQEQKDSVDEITQLLSYNVHRSDAFDVEEELCAIEEEILLNNKASKIFSTPSTTPETSQSIDSQPQKPSDADQLKLLLDDTNM